MREPLGPDIKKSHQGDYAENPDGHDGGQGDRLIGDLPLGLAKCLRLSLGVDGRRRRCGEPFLPPFRQPGNRTGTPLYMAPEIVRRRSTDKRVDIFALGVAAYRLLTFEHPWPGEDITGKAALAHDTVAPIDIRKFRPGLNRLLAEAITSCISPNVDDRPESAEQFLFSIRRIEGVEE